ncbi:MAG: DUF4923 family protein [Bacteroidales bacterium]|nr:DUF4923 family protein [Bacteroidales bacterium]
MKKHSLILLLFFVSSVGVKAQSWLDIFSSDKVNKATKVISEVTGISTANDLKGTWKYAGTAVQLKSDNTLQQIGGALATSTLEQKINEKLETLGIKPNELSFTFHTDSTFSSNLRGRKLDGTYQYDSKEQTINFQYAGLLNLTAKVNQSTQYVSFLYDADKLLTLLATLSEMTNNQTLKSIGSLAASYDGIMMGLKLKKQGS